jgi:hypothetical protein
MKKVAFLGAKRKQKLSVDETKRRLAVGELSRLFRMRYGGDYDWRFPDDDAGHEDLMILAHHYASNPMALPRIIRQRAPWADADAVMEEVTSNPQRYQPAVLGRLLGYTGREWRAWRTKMIASIDMTKAERSEFSTNLSNERRRIKRRRSGMQSRKQYLAQNSLSREKPWLAEGVSKATWYRRRRRGLTLAEWNEKARAIGIGTKRHATLGDVRQSLKAKGLVREEGGRWKTTTVGCDNPI